MIKSFEQRKIHLALKFRSKLNGNKLEWMIRVDWETGERVNKLEGTGERTRGPPQFPLALENGW